LVVLDVAESAIMPSAKEVYALRVVRVRVDADRWNAYGHVSAKQPEAWRERRILPRRGHASRLSHLPHDMWCPFAS